MKYAYYITEKVQKDLSKTNLMPKISDELKSDLSSSKQLDVKYSNCEHPKIKVHRFRTSGGPRFIYYEEVRNETTLYVLRKVYQQHDDYLNDFSEAKKDWWYAKNMYDDDEQAEIDRKFAELGKIEAKDILPEEFRTYEERPRRFEASKDCVIYELPEWVSGYADVEKTDKRSIYSALYDLLVNKNTVGKYVDGFHLIEADGGYTIVLRYETSINGGHMNSVYLLQVSKSDNIGDLKEHKYDCPNVKSLIRKAAKCYPDFLLIDFKSWNAIEDDNQANLALSEEELSVLQNTEYPFFVSGLAGSGKSTILYYMFAHIYDYEAKHQKDHRLLFLSYSKKLIANAQNIVESILRNHSAYDSAYIFEDKELRRKFDLSFQPFQEFIKSEFLSVEDMERFSSSKYIDYKRFKQLYQTCKLPESRNYSPDIVWSVIRTFIKGKKDNDIFTPQDYENQNLPSKDRTVAKDDFRKIYKIWDNWYKKFYTESTGWDDLDLVRYALSKHEDYLKYHKYAVIFCDEAQDFTKIETDLILKLSVYSKYDLSTRDTDADIPIAFAGDPNQTINPTGFRWGGIQDIFNESFKDSLASFTGFKPRELCTNYRSREGIVKFANTIQYIRHYMLSDGKQHFTMQKVWGCDTEGTKDDSEGLNYVAFYSLDKDRDAILRGMKKAIIITAEEGGICCRA